MRAASRASSAGASRVTASRAATAARIPGTYGKPATLASPRSSVAPGTRQRTPVRTAITPTPPGPPHLCALPVSTDQPSGGAPLPRLWAASTTRGTSRARHTAATSSTGWRVPTSWFALWRQASAVSPRSAAANASMSTRPSRSTATSDGAASEGMPTCCRCSRACSTDECSTAEATVCCPTRRRPAASPATARCTACVPEAVKDTSSGRHPSRVAIDSRAWSSCRRTRRPAPYRRAGSAQPWSSVPSVASTFRAAGCSGSLDAASRYPGGGRGTCRTLPQDRAAVVPGSFDMLPERRYPTRRPGVRCATVSL